MLKRPPQDLVNKMVAEEAAIVGIDPGFVLHPVFRRKCRKAVVVRARVSLKLLDTGKYSPAGIGSCLKLDRTAVLHYNRTRERWLA